RLNLRRVLFHSRTLKFTNGATGYWTAEGSPIPLSKPVIAGATLSPKRIGTIVCATTESIGVQNRMVEAQIQNDIVEALALSIDQAFLDASNTGSSTMPAAATVGVDTVPATGDP